MWPDQVLLGSTKIGKMISRQMDTFEMFGENFLLMHDNTRPHMARCVSEKKQGRGPHVLQTLIRLNMSGTY